MRSSLKYIPLILLLLQFVSTVQANTRTIEIPVAVKFKGVAANSLSWALESDPRHTNDALGVIREGDKATISIINASDMIFAQSKVVYRWFVSKRCRKRFLRRSKCTETWANGPCLTPMSDNPASGKIKTRLTFLKDNKDGPPSVVKNLDLGNGLSTVTFEPAVPVRLNISGGLKKTLPKCSRSMKGKPLGAGKPTLHGTPVGSGNPVSWFTIKLTISTPELEN